MDQSALPELLADDGHRVTLQLSSRTAAVLNDLAIHVGPLHATPRAEPLRIRRDAMVEGFTFHPPCDLGELGAFSYSKAEFTDYKAGRYCSIGAGLAVFGERHPIEHVTTSSIAYGFGPDWNKPHFVSAHARLLGNRYEPDMPGGLFGPEPVLEHDVWLGGNVTLARGITVGTGAVIGASAVVTRSVPPYAIVGGNPARIIRMRFPDDLARRLLWSEWWTYHPRCLFDFDRKNPARFIDQFDDAREAGRLEPLVVPRVNADDLMARIAAVPHE
jgi:acetyltransferase-like isoleucine patch superfamily enzyme